MSPAALVAITVAAVLVLWPKSLVERRVDAMSAAAPSSGPGRLDPWWAIWAGPATALVFAGAGPAVAGALVAALVAVRRRRARRAAAREAEVADLVRGLAVMCAELSVGAPTVTACRAAADELDRSGATSPVGEELSRMAARAELGGAPGGPDEGVAGRLAHAWSTSLQYGLPVADSLAALRADLTARGEFAARTAAGLAGPRATAAVLAGLPVLGILLGEGMGAGPVHVLMGTGIGNALLVVGTLLVVAGMEWSYRITERAVRP
ncbi:type II secretion system F family protein [Gordonia shandongensis]|uniref:type II secretion system F family protein n=1 Tax=Gordonia shandongensis TaxID=376351 RepID=UPI000416D5C4|nr:type II secretion system F family protein [Gordonia shandongensis]